MVSINKYKNQLDYIVDLGGEIMVKETITRIKLISAEGMILTNGEIFGKEIFLSENDTPENWHEITEEEYENIQAEINSKNADMEMGV
jgi:hypothetical protein